MSIPLSQRSVIGIILILSPQVFSFAFALDIYAPSIPVIKTFFGTTQSVIQLTISLFLLITGVGQLLLGPISDQIGRRKILLVSIAMFTLGSILCMFAMHISFLIVARMIQAFGACGMMVSAFAIVRDLFSGDDCGKIYSFLNSTIALSPLFAPLIGGYLAYWISWRAPFALLALMGVAIFISGFLTINETLDVDKRRLFRKDLWSNYAIILKNKHFLKYTFCAAAGFAGFLTFFSSSAYIIISLLHIPEEHFGFYFGAIGIVFFIGSIISGYSIKAVGIHKTVVLGAILMTLAGGVMLYWYWRTGLNMIGFMGPMLIMGIGGAMLMGGGAGGAIEPFPEMAGTASALFGCSEFIFAFFVSQLVLMWQVTSTVPLSLTLTLLGSLAFIMCLRK